MLIQPFQRLEELKPEWNAREPGVRESLFFLFDSRSYVQLRITRTTQKTIKIAKSQSRLRAIGTERLNSRLWRTEIFLLRKESHQSTAARVSLT
jgi:hypothetical protein